jgi:hypothetical protein
MNWFEELMGFQEDSPQQVQANITLDGNTLESRINGNRLQFGSLETPSLGELRDRVHSCKYSPGKVSVREVVADVQQLHSNAVNSGSMFQVASQFNLLEMVSPNKTPEHGVGIYENDRTQGPACAVAAGAGTIYRNYFAPVNGQTGQSIQNQIDCLEDIGNALGNSNNSLWNMSNGYALASRAGLLEISNKLQVASQGQRDELRQLLRVGIQQNTEVTLGKSRHTVSQVYCSALPVAYTNHPPSLWEPFARLVLEATYEATICAAILNSNNRLFLTFIGGGVFGNEHDWIVDAIQRSLKEYAHVDLDVVIVSFGSPKRGIQCLLTDTRD